MDYEKIGKRIRDLRRQQGYTQDALAEAVDLSAPFISHIERASKRASLETIFRIAKVLNVTVDYLLTGTRSVDAAAFAYTGSNLPAARRISARWPEKTCHPAGRVRQ